MKITLLYTQGYLSKLLSFIDEPVSHYFCTSNLSLSSSICG